jgi:copper chaperone CopZ
MKNLILFLFLALSTSIFAQKPVVITIQTSAQCGDCKQRIETALNQTKGVVYAELNQETKAVEVKFKPSKTDAATIKTALTLVGYDADESKPSSAKSITAVLPARWALTAFSVPIYRRSRFRSQI